MITSPYERLVAASEALVATDELEQLAWDFQADAATVWVEQNRATLTTARRCLTADCRVPLRFDPTFFAEHSPQLPLLRQLARAFSLEGKLAVVRGHDDAAARVGIDLLDLANAIRRGGLLVDFLVSIAVAGGAVSVLRKIRSRCDARVRKFLWEQFQRVEAEEDALEAIRERDQRWEETSGNDEDEDLEDPFLRSLNEMDDLDPEARQLLETWFQEQLSLSPSERDGQYDQFERAHLALLRMLAVDLALREYFEREGHYPPTLARLSPGILAAIPLDPFTGKPFVYRRTDNRWLAILRRGASREEPPFLLYSPVRKKLEARVRFGPLSEFYAGEADLCLDAEDCEGDG